MIDPAVYVIQKLLHFLVLCSNFLLFKEGVEARLVGVGERGVVDTQARGRIYHIISRILYRKGRRLPSFFCSHS